MKKIEIQKTQISKTAKIPSIDFKKFDIAIFDSTTLQTASTYLIQAKKLLKSSKEDMDRLIDPLKESIANIKEKYAPTQDALKQVIDDLTQKTTAYQTNLVNAQREAESAITARIAPGKGNLTLETAVKKLEALPQVDKNLTTETGSMTFVEHQMCELEDITKLPLQYHLADMVQIRAQMKAGNKLPGVRYWTEQRPRNTR